MTTLMQSASTAPSLQVVTGTYTNHSTGSMRLKHLPHTAILDTHCIAMPLCALAEKRALLRKVRAVATSS